jgi:hypothetical protein
MRVVGFEHGFGCPHGVAIEDGACEPHGVTSRDRLAGANLLEQISGERAEMAPKQPRAGLNCWQLFTNFQCF